MWGEMGVVWGVGVSDGVSECGIECWSVGRTPHKMATMPLGGRRSL